MEHNNQIIDVSATLQQILQRLDLATHKVLFVVDPQGKLLGSISDGDVRRALLNANPELLTAKKICNNTPAYFDAYGKLHNDYKNNYLLIPALDHKHQIKQFRTPQERPPCNTMVIMAGGLGTRLGHLTEEIPKPLVPISGKPMLDHIIMNAHSQGITNFILCLNHMSQQIEKHIKKYEKGSIKISCVIEKHKLDTAGALSLLMKDLLPETFYVKNCDVFENTSYNKFFEQHQTENADVSIMTLTNELTVPYGVINSENKRITSIIEKPNIPFQVSGGLYIFNRTALEYLQYDTPISMPDFVNRLIGENLTVIQYNENSTWIDAGTTADIAVINS